MVTGALKKSEEWKLMFKNMSSLELADEFEVAMTQDGWYEIDTETGRPKHLELLTEISFRFYNIMRSGIVH